MTACCSTNKKKKYDQLILNHELLRLRLNQDEKEYYTDLYYNRAEKGKVNKENFPPLLGMLGTQIAKEFADRIFFAFSSNKEYITLSEYLKYIDIYHYGDDIERCKVTCKLIDKNGNDKITYDEFKDYINLILNAIKKVNPGFSSDTMNDNDIKTLFYHIAKKGDYFTSKDFEEIYNEKPELVSWIDYFKNNSEDVLIIINEHINCLLKGINSFFQSFLNYLDNILNKNEFYFDNIINEINDYSHEFLKIQKKFLKKVQQFSIRNIFDELSNNEQEKKKRDLLKSINLRKENNKNGFNDSDIENDPMLEKFFQKIKKDLNNYLDDIPISEENISSSDCYSNNHNNQNEYEENNSSKNFNNSDSQNKSNKSNINISIIDFDLSGDEKKENNNILNQESSITESEEKTIIQNNSELDYEFDQFFKDEDDKMNNIDSTNNISTNPINNINYNHNNNNNLINNNNIPIYKKDNNPINNNNSNNSRNYNQKKSKKQFNQQKSLQIKNRDELMSNNTFTKKNSKKISNNVRRANSFKKKATKKLFDQFFKKNYYEIKQFLLSLKLCIENAKDTSTTIEVCFHWISESYLNSHIKRILKTKNKEKLDQLAPINKNRKMKKKIKKKIIKAPDQSFKILLNMIMGIQIAVQSSPNYKIDDNEDLSKYLNSMLYSVQTINFSIKKQETFFLKEYAGIIFNNIRRHLGFDKDSFISSISPQEFITELMISSQTIFEELISTGKSGSLFYYTRDGQFIVKTIGHNEYKFLKKILPNYYRHLKQNPMSLLPKFFGCYQLIRKVKKQKEKFNFIVMQNVFSTTKQIHIRFDLKGSKIGRKVLKGNKEDNDILNKGDIALKDLDLEARKEKAYLGEKRDIFINQLIKDTEFLSKNGAIDYSLLLGIHYNHKEINKKNSKTNVLSRKVTQRNMRHESKLIKTMTSYEDNKFLSSNNINVMNKFFESDSYFNINNNNNDDNNSLKSARKRLSELKNLWDYDDGGINSITGNEIYYLGIIDILTEYNCKKGVEHFVKMIRYCSEKMSCVPPITYKNRFDEYMENVILNDHPSKETQIVSENKE